jgi:hypothetical protein
MAGKTAEETSDRKRISIPKADVSVLEWWENQHDPGASVRMLIRSEIERNGYVDTAYGRVTQLPRRGRPGSASEGEAGEPHPQPTPAPAPTLAAAPVAAVPRPTPVAAQLPPTGGTPDALDALMNG